MSRTKKVVEKSVTPQEIQDYAEQRYIDEVLTEHPPVEDDLPKPKHWSCSDEIPKSKYRGCSTPALSIWTAISDFQQEVPILIQNNSTTKYTYVDLAEIVRVITPILHKHNLAYIQPLQNDNVIKTILFHTITGEQIISEVKIPIVELDYMNLYQSIGSAITYYRRYSISSLLNLISEKDNDAQGTQKRSNPAVSNPAVPKPIPTPSSIKPKHPLTADEFNRAVISIQKGEYSIAELQENYILTDAMISKLREL